MNASHAFSKGDHLPDDIAPVAPGRGAGFREAVVAAVRSEADQVADEPARYALDFGEAWLRDEILHDLPAIEHPANFVQECRQVPLDVPVKGDEGSVDVVYGLRFARRFGQEDREATGEGFGIASMLGDQGEDFREKPGFATRPADDGFGLCCYRGMECAPSL